jgi:hypothetical protein
MGHDSGTKPESLERSLISNPPRRDMTNCALALGCNAET